MDFGAYLIGYVWLGAGYIGDMIARTVAILLWSLFLMKLIGNKYRKALELQNQLRLTKDLIEMMYYSSEQIRRIRHDMKYHMNVISGLFNESKYEELHQYLKSYQKDFKNGVFTLSNYTRNEAVNILLEYYEIRAKENGIQAHFEADIPSNIMMEETHLITLLGNIIQNAYEACLKLAES